MKRFLQKALAEYPVNRDRPDVVRRGYLHFGEISPGQVWRAILDTMNDDRKAGEAYLRQTWLPRIRAPSAVSSSGIAKPGFAAGIRYVPMARASGAFQGLEARQDRLPLVDAGMRALWHTGWMHNWVRMVVASFLVKHLQIGWQEALPGSGTRWWMPTWRITRLAGNGSRATARMRCPISESSIRQFRPGSSIRRRLCAPLGAGVGRGMGRGPWRRISTSDHRSQLGRRPGTRGAEEHRQGRPRPRFRAMTAGIPQDLLATREG